MPGSSGIDFLMFGLLIPFNVIMLGCRFAACEFVRGGLFPRRPPARLKQEEGYRHCCASSSASEL